MAVVVVGGQTRNIGKTSAVAGLIKRLPEFRWTAFKITQYGHGFCTADGRPCQCQAGDACISLSMERDAASGTDTSRFLAAGAARSIWVRTRIGMLAEAVPRIADEIARSENVILESNSILEFLEPDLYLSVIDPAAADFKVSAQRFLRRADAVLCLGHSKPLPCAVQESQLQEVTIFPVEPPHYLSDDVVQFVRARLEQNPATQTIESHATAL